MIQQQQYQPVAFNNIVPVLDIGDPSQEFIQSMSGIGTALESDLSQIQQNSKTELANIERRNNEVKSLLNLTTKGAELYAGISNEKTKTRLAEIFAENYNRDPETDTDWAAEGAAWNGIAGEQQKDADDLDTAVSINLNNKEEVTSEDTAAAAKIRKLSGREATVAANARAQAAAESYQSAYESWISRVNPAPGEETVAARNEFNRRWGEQTGLSSANSGFLAANVYPRIRREGAAIEESQRRGWTASADAQKADEYLMDLQSTGDLNAYSIKIKGLTKSDGKTLRTNEDVWSSLTRAELSTEVLNKLGKSQFAATGKTWADHPRFQALLTASRNRKRAEVNAQRTEAGRRFRSEYVPGMTTSERQALRQRQLDENPGMRDLIYNAYSSAESMGAQSEKNSEQTELYEDFLSNRPAGSKPTMAEWTRAGGDAAWATKNANRFAEDVKQESAEEQIRDSQQFKDLRKDIVRTVNNIDKDVSIVADSEGGGGPSNSEAFITQSQNDIVNRAIGLMLTPEYDTWEKALTQATKDWRESVQKLSDGGKLYNKDTKMMFEDGLNFGTGNAARNQAILIRKATINNVGTGLLKEDLSRPADGQYSERVKTTGQMLGLTPEQVVNYARKQKGLEPLEPTPATTSLGRVNPKTLAAIASLDSNKNTSIMRAQIQSGETLSGTPQEKTIAVGQMLTTLGVTNLWQHKDFDWNYTGTGSEAIGSHVQGSAHYDDRAIDIGQQGNNNMNAIYAYLYKNKERFGIRQLIYKDQFYGTGGPVSGHDHHIHVGW